MRTDLLKYLRGKYAFDTNLKAKFGVMGVCLLLALVFWLLNVLSAQYTMRINYHVHYTGSNPNFVVEGVQDELFLQVKADGFDLIKYYFQVGKPEINIDVSKLYLSKKESGKLKRISSKTLLAEFSGQVESGLALQQIYPDSLALRIYVKGQKNVPVKLRHRLSFEKQHTLFDRISVKPPVVRVSGPKALIDTLDYIYTDSLVLEKLSSTATQRVKLQSDKNITVDPDAVLVSIPVEEFTEQRIEVPVVLINVPDSLEVKIYPDKVSLTMIVPLSKYKQVLPDQFKATANMQEGLEGKERLKVELKIKPDAVQVRKMEPSKVEFIMRRK